LIGLGNLSRRRKAGKEAGQLRKRLFSKELKSQLEPGSESGLCQRWWVNCPVAAVQEKMAYHYQAWFGMDL
jgi:hypothetical protein